MVDFQKKLNSKEAKCQKAAPLLKASIVQSQSALASKVAKKFDFKLKAFSKLTEYKYNQKDKRMTHLSRKAFVGFAMSFLRWGGHDC